MSLPNNDGETGSKIYQATAAAPVNIAVPLQFIYLNVLTYQVIKYWGKRSTKLNLPSNSSISVTLSQKDLRALTTASCCSSFPDTRLWLNGIEQPLASNHRVT